jgi:hypothetical protein
MMEEYSITLEKCNFRFISDSSGVILVIICRYSKAMAGKVKSED